MRIHRIHTDQPLEPERTVVLGGDCAHYLGRVLRAAPGWSIVLFNGNGHDYAAEILQLAKKRVEVQVRAKLPAAGESGLHITLVQALSRGERMDQTLQKATELGVAAFQPILTERSTVRLKPEKLENRMAHWHRVIISACEQSGRARIPDLHNPCTLQNWLERSINGDRLVLDQAADSALAQFSPAGPVELAVGPEGGFSRHETDSMKIAGVAAVSIGPRILRTETAGPAAIAVLQAIGGDFQTSTWVMGRTP
jgi:16S rRNA (uracil1498-N3)-methyltransferase